MVVKYKSCKIGIEKNAYLMKLTYEFPKFIKSIAIIPINPSIKTKIKISLACELETIISFESFSFMAPLFIQAVY